MNSSYPETHSADDDMYQFSAEANPTESSSLFVISNNYGICLSCGFLISPVELKAFPDTLYCGDCVNPSNA